MAKSPDDRYASMNDVLFALKQCLGNAVQSTGEYRIPDFGELRPEVLTSTTRTLEQLPPANTQNTTASHPVPKPFAQAQKPSSSTAPLIFAGIFALTGVGGFLALSGPLSEDKPVQVVTAAPTSAPAPTTAPAPPPKPATVMVSLRSTPPGAMVLIGDREYGPTPIELEWTGTDAEPGRQVSFRFRRTGFRALTITREVRGDRMQVEASFLDPVGQRKAGGANPTDPNDPSAL
ncbi:MAG TPA: hypothetical protein VI299_08035 [Polyangiales bacterium]